MPIKKIKKLIRAAQGKLTAVVSGEKPCRDENLIREYQDALDMRKNPYAAWIVENEGVILENAGNFETEDSGKSDGNFIPPEGWILVRTVDTYPAKVQKKIWDKMLSENPKAQLIYGDEDYIQKNSDGKVLRTNPFFKPDYSPETLESFNYFGECIYIRSDIAIKLEIENKGRVVYKNPDEIYGLVLNASSEGIPAAHYSAIMSHKSTGNLQSEENKEKNYGKKSDAEGSQQVFPNVNIVILSKDNPPLLEKCLNSIRTITDYPNMEISVTDNGSSKEHRAEYEKITKKYDAAYYYEPSEFNFSRLCNSGVKNSGDGLILLMNDDVEVIEPDYMKVMAGYAQKSEIGAVGAVLLYGDGKSIQHDGITMLKESGPVHLLCGYSDDRDYYFGRNRVTYNVSAVTAACMMVKKSLYEEMNGLDEDFAVAYNDVDFCLRLLEKGYRNVLCGGVRLIHHESLTRGRDETDGTQDKAGRAKWERLGCEREKLERKHPRLTGRDPYYNDNLSDYPSAYECSKLFPETDEKYFCRVSRISDKINASKYSSANSISDNNISSKNISEKNIRFYLQDFCTRKTAVKQAEEILYLKGAILVTGADQICFSRCLVMKNTVTDEMLFCNCIDTYLPGIERLIWSEKHALLSGFVVRIKLEDIPEGDYLIGVQVTSKNGERTGIHMSDRHFNKVNG